MRTLWTRPIASDYAAFASRLRIDSACNSNRLSTFAILFLIRWCTSRRRVSFSASCFSIFSSARLRIKAEPICAAMSSRISIVSRVKRPLLLVVKLNQPHNPAAGPNRYQGCRGIALMDTVVPRMSPGVLIWGQFQKKGTSCLSSCFRPGWRADWKGRSCRRWPAPSTFQSNITIPVPAYTALFAAFDNSGTSYGILIINLIIIYQKIEFIRVIIAFHVQMIIKLIDRYNPVHSLLINKKYWWSNL